MKIASPCKIAYVQVNVVPVKQALKGHVEAWINMFRDALKSALQTKLGSLLELMAASEEGL